MITEKEYNKIKKEVQIKSTVKHYTDYLSTRFKEVQEEAEKILKEHQKQDLNHEHDHDHDHDHPEEKKASKPAKIEKKPKPLASKKPTAKKVSKK